MKVIIAGSRTLELDLTDIVKASGFTVTTVVEGGARGIDYAARMWAEANNIPVITMKADWDLYGNAAGPVRNEDMANIADALIAVWDGSSRGTQHMIRAMNKKKKPVYIHRVDQMIRGAL